MAGELSNIMSVESYSSDNETIRPMRPPPTPSANNVKAARRLSATSYTTTGSSSRVIRQPPSPPSRAATISPPRAGAQIARPLSPPGQRPRSVMTNRSSMLSSAPHAQSQLAEKNAPNAEELAKFAELCRALYFEKDAAAALAMDTILNRLPAQSRTPYARTMAAIRSAFHRDEEIRRRTLVETTLAAFAPAQHVKSALRVSVGGTTAMRSALARRTRARLLQAFILAHCDKSMPGTHPFFKSLYGALKLQSMKQGQGGAGGRVVEWEVDVAVFSEASGGSWMQDSIEVLKAVLGFSERIKDDTASSSDYLNRDDDASSPGLTTALLPPASPPTPKRAPPAVPPHRGSTSQPKSARDRATSDPFLDPNDRTRTPVSDGGPLTPPVFSHTASSSASSSASASPAPSPSLSPSLSPSPAPQIRIFTLPTYFTDPELVALCGVFPDYIAQPANKALASSLSATASRSSSSSFKAGQLQQDDDKSDDDHERRAEEGRLAHTRAHNGQIRVGHGELFVSTAARDSGWRGSLFERLWYWIRTLLRLGP